MKKFIISILIMSLFMIVSVFAAYPSGVTSVYHLDNNSLDALGVRNGTVPAGSFYGSALMSLGLKSNVTQYTYMNLSSPSLPTYSAKEITFSMWVKPASVHDGDYLLFYLGTGVPNSWYIYTTGGKFGVTGPFAANNYNTTNATLVGNPTVAGGTMFANYTYTANNWYHLVVTRRSTGDIYIYINGQEKHLGAGNATFAPNRGYSIGTYCITSGGTCSNLGNITYDEYAFWSNQSLSASEVADLYNNGSGLVYGADITPPVIYPPSNASATYGTWSGTNFTFTDDIGIGSASVNNTLFNITTSGILNKTSTLGVANYLVNVSVNDTSNNTASYIYALNITQATGIAYQYINNSRSNLTVRVYSGNVSGTITSNCTTYGQTNVTTPTSSTYSVGNHTFNCSLDNSQNYTAASEIFYLSVITDTTPPTLSSPSNATVTFGNSWSGATFNCSDNWECVNSTWRVNATNYSITNGTLVNTSSIPIGSYLLNVSVNDSSNNLASSLYNFTVLADTESPTFTYVPPNMSIPYGTNWSGVNFTASDNVAISNWTLNNTNFNYTISADKSTLNINRSSTFGNYYTNICVLDTVNNSRCTIYNFNATDVTNPTFTLFASNGTYEYSRGATVMFTGSDDIQVNNLYINDSSLSVTNIIDGITVSVPANKPVGNYSVLVSVNDTSGNLGTSVWNFTIYQYNTTPILTSPSNITQIFELQNVSSTFNASANIPYVNITSFNVNDSLFTINSSGYFNATNNNLSIGVYNINVSVNDTFNNTNSLLYVVTIIKDTVPPVFDFHNITSVIVWSGTFIGVTDNVGIQNCTLDDYTYFHVNNTNGTCFLTLNQNVNYGNYSVNITAYDTNNNTATLPWQLEYQHQLGNHFWTCPASDEWDFIYLIFGIAAAFIVLALVLGEGLFGLLGGIIVTGSYFFIGPCNPMLMVVVPIGGILLCLYFILYFQGKK